MLREGSRTAVVDAGDAAPVIDYLDREDLRLSAILCTHHHGDHVGGNTGLLARWKVPVFGPAREDIPGRTHALAQGDRIDVPGIGIQFSVLDIPGHTAGHIAFSGERMLFCGDTLFAGGCGRLFEGTPEQMTASLDKLSALSSDTAVYCGHEYTVSNLRFALAVEPDNEVLRTRAGTEQAKRDRQQPTLPSTIGAERATNPFLRVDEPSVRAAAERRAGRALGNRVAVFAEIRAWKNEF